MVRHHDERVEFVVTFGTVMLEGFKQKFSITGDLEEASPIGGDGRDEERAGRGGSLWDGHCGIVMRKGTRLRMPKRESIEGAFTRDLGFVPSQIFNPIARPEGHAFTHADNESQHKDAFTRDVGFDLWCCGGERNTERRAFGRAEAPSARLVCGTLERVPFRFETDLAFRSCLHLPRQIISSARLPASAYSRWG